MKKMIHLLLLTLLLLGAMSTSSLADGGSPPPMCSPGNCSQAERGSPCRQAAGA